MYIELHTPLAMYEKGKYVLMDETKNFYVNIKLSQK